MSRSIKTWFILALVLAVAAQAAVAKGPSLGKGISRSSISRPSVRSAAIPRMSQARMPARSSMGNVRPSTGNRASAIRSGNQGSNVRSITPRNNTSNLTPIARNRTPIDRGNLVRTNPVSPNLGTGNLVRNNPIVSGNAGRLNSGSSNNSSGNDSNRIPRNQQQQIPRREPDRIPRIQPTERPERPVVPELPELADAGPPGRSIPRGPSIRNPLPGASDSPSTGLPANPSPDAPPSNRVPVNPPSNRVPVNPTPVDPPATVYPRDPLPINPPVANDRSNPGNDEIGTGVADLEPFVPDQELIVTDGDGVEIPGVGPVEDAPAPIDAGTVVSTISDLISQFAGGGGGAAADSGGYGVEEAADYEPTLSESVDAVADEPGSADSMDIELTEVRLVAAGNVEQKVGPRFRLYCRNNGSVEAPKFHVSVLVDVGKELTETAHMVTIESVGMMPGKSQTIDVQLPVEVLKMTTENDPWARPFETFAAIIDSDDSLTETNEDNNVLLLARDAIKSVKTASTKRPAAKEAKSTNADEVSSVN